MGEEIEFENGPKWSSFRLSWASDLDLDLRPGHGHYLFFISHRVLPVYQISSKSKKLFVDGRTDGRKFATHSIRSTSKLWKSTKKLHVCSIQVFHAASITKNCLTNFSLRCREQTCRLAQVYNFMAESFCPSIE